MLGEALDKGTHITRGWAVIEGRLYLLFAGFQRFDPLANVLESQYNCLNHFQVRQRDIRKQRGTIEV